MPRDTAGEEDNSFLYFSFWGSPDEQGERLDENSGSLKREEGGKNNFTKEEPYHYSIRVLIRLFEV